MFWLWMNLFCKNIRLIRIIRGYSQENLAAYLKKSQNWVSAVESGKLWPALHDRQAIADFLEISLDDLECSNFTYVKEEAMAVGSRIEFLEQELELLKKSITAIKNRLDC